jgi:hypothetical protein
MPDCSITVALPAEAFIFVVLNSATLPVTLKVIWFNAVVQMLLLL